jgi:inner membrane transporter RhtA
MAVRDRAPAQALSSNPPAESGPPAPPASGVPLILVAISSLQFGAAIAGTIFDETGPAGTALLRAFFAAVILLAIWRPSVRGRSARDLRLVAAFGLVLGAMNLCIYESFARIPLGIAITIEFAGPLALAVALSRRRLDLVWAALAAAGIVLLSDPGGGRIDALGVVFALVAATFWAAYILIAQAAGRVFTGGRGVALAMAVAVLVPLGPGLAGAGSALLDPRWLGIGCAVAVMSSVLPYSLETEALRRVPANVFGVLMSLEPAVAAVAGFAVLGQDLRTRDIVAIALVVAASIGVTRVAPLPPEA